MKKNNFLGDLIIQFNHMVQLKFKNIRLDKQFAHIELGKRILIY